VILVSNSRLFSSDFMFDRLVMVSSAMISHQVLGCLVIFAALNCQQRSVDAYNVLLIPIPGRSHLFSMAAMAGGLASRCHRVSLLAGENFPADDLPEVRNWSKITVVRYSDTSESNHTTDYEAMFENVTIQAMVHHVDMWSLVPEIRDRLSTPFQYSQYLTENKCDKRTQHIN